MVPLTIEWCCERSCELSGPVVLSLLDEGFVDVFFSDSFNAFSIIFCSANDMPCTSD